MSDSRVSHLGVVVWLSGTSHGLEASRTRPRVMQGQGQVLRIEYLSVFVRGEVHVPRSCLVGSNHSMFMPPVSGLSVFS